MKREEGFKWLFLDLNSYFASVEQQENPHLRGRPVIVVPADTDYTCAIAVSYEARIYGIKTGTMVQDAKRLCPFLHCVVARHDVYVAYHHRIIEEIIKHTPINDICSIDELSSRLPPSKRNIESAAILAQNIKEGIWHNVGEAIHCSIGFAPNALLAKLACNMRKPNGMTIIQQHDLPNILYGLQLSDITGIGHNMERRLHAANIKTLKDFCSISPKHARKVWRNVEGERLWHLLHGYDFVKPRTNTCMTGHSRVLDGRSRTPASAKNTAKTLTEKAAQRLRVKGFFAQKITLSIRTTLHAKGGRCAHLVATQNSFTFLQYLNLLWEDIMGDISAQHHDYGPALKILKVSVVLHDLITPELITDDFWGNHFTPHHHSHNHGHLTPARQSDKLVQAMDHLKEKYKRNVVSIGAHSVSRSEYMGTKIAFSRVPEQEEF